MSAETERGHTALPQEPAHEEAAVESLTDLIDRMDREAFRRSLEQRDLHVVGANLRRKR